MTDSIREVHAITYEGFVREAINVGPDDESIEQFIRRLETYGVSVDGEWRVYWPAPGPWFVADRLSERAAVIVARLLNDWRFMPSVAAGMHHEPVDGARAVASLANQEVGPKWRPGTNLTAQSTRTSDGRVQVWMRFRPETRGYHPQADLEQAAPAVRTIFVESVD